MFIIVGLGNPTRQYEGTKHNVGFDTIDYLIDEYQIPSSGAGHKALFGKGMIAGQKVIVAKPMTYMNLSGESVRELVNYYKVADYVLSPFTKDERPLVNLAIEHAAKAIEQMLNGDVDAAMNEYNRKSANPAE